MTPRLSRVVLFTLIHAALTLGLGLYATSAALNRFDGFETPPGAATAAVAADVLILPGYLLWTSWASKNLPNAVEWLLFLANSALWGLAISAVVGMRRRAR